MNNTKSDTNDSSDVEKFLADRQRRLNATAAKKRSLAQAAQKFALSDAADQLKATLPGPGSGRIDAIALATVTDGLLEFVRRCRELEADERLNDIIQVDSPVESEKHARGLIMAATTGSRQSLLRLLRALSKCPQKVQDESWELVGWLADRIDCPPRPPVMILTPENLPAKPEGAGPSFDKKGERNQDAPASGGTSYLAPE